ncbi:MAG: cytidylate kinase [Syntrophorhabdus sp. PtaU1.Bin058]|nr:MAG: cytidylate kinase [Syntrophorhabdus sp. PtaU1.Bin058]
MNKYAAITVSRQMGSGGTYIGYQVAKALGFSYVDRQILRRAASLLNRDEVSLEEYEEKSSGLIQNLLRTFLLGTPETAYIPKERPIYDKDLFLLESKIINEIVDKHNAVIMGRCGFCLLKDRPKTVHLFIYAPRDYRTERIMKADSTADPREAQARIDESDRRRTKFIRDMVGTEWTDARNYHLCVDSSTVGLSESVQMVIGFVKKALG